jgi:hypothetical protein
VLQYPFNKRAGVMDKRNIPGGILVPEPVGNFFLPGENAYNFPVGVLVMENLFGIIKRLRAETQILGSVILPEKRTGNKRKMLIPEGNPHLLPETGLQELMIIKDGT